MNRITFLHNSRNGQDSIQGVLSFDSPSLQNRLLLLNFLDDESVEESGALTLPEEVVDLCDISIDSLDSSTFTSMFLTATKTDAYFMSTSSVVGASSSKISQDNNNNNAEAENETNETKQTSIEMGSTTNGMRIISNHHPLLSPRDTILCSCSSLYAPEVCLLSQMNCFLLDPQEGVLYSQATIHNSGKKRSEIPLCLSFCSL